MKRKGKVHPFYSEIASRAAASANPYGSTSFKKSFIYTLPLLFLSGFFLGAASILWAKGL